MEMNQKYFTIEESVLIISIIKLSQAVGTMISLPN